MSRDTSFYYSFLVLPPRKRAAIVAVWDFCRAVDDAVDEVVPEAEWQGGLTPDARARATALLAGWRVELDAVYTGTPRTPQGLALQPHTREFNLPRRQFEAAAELAPERRREIRASLGVPLDVPLVGKVARLEEPKGHRFFLDLAERLAGAHPTAHFVAIGVLQLLFGLILGDLLPAAAFIAAGVYVAADLLKTRGVLKQPIYDQVRGLGVPVAAAAAVIAVLHLALGGHWLF